MKLHLVYRGALKSNGGAPHKMAIRRTLHAQLRWLWDQKPVSSLRDRGALSSHDEKPKDSILVPVGPFTFAPLVTTRYALVAGVDVLLLRPQEPGNILRHAGDLDNRLKTLLDSLSTPSLQDLPPGDAPRADESPFCTLLEDDGLVVSVAVRTGRLLEPAHPNEVLAIIEVDVRPTVGTWGNISLAGT